MQTLSAIVQRMSVRTDTTLSAALAEARDDLLSALREIADAESYADPHVRKTALEFALISVENAKLSLNLAKERT